MLKQSCPRCGAVSYIPYNPGALSNQSAGVRVCAECNHMLRVIYLTQEEYEMEMLAKEYIANAHKRRENAARADSAYRNGGLKSWGIQ